MFICLLKAHPWVLTPTSSTAKRNISSRRRWRAICVCVFVWVKGGGSWGSSSLHQMRLSAGTLLSQTGTHLPMVSCEVLGEERNKGAKRLCDNEGAPRRAFKCGDTGCTGQAVPITPQLLFCAIQRPCEGIHSETQGHEQPRRGPRLAAFSFLYRADRRLITTATYSKSPSILWIPLLKIWPEHYEYIFPLRTHQRIWSD